MKLEFYRQIFTKYSDIKFYENPYIGSGIVPCGRMDVWTDRQTDTMKLTAAFRNIAHAPKKE